MPNEKQQSQPREGGERERFEAWILKRELMATLKRTSKSGAYDSNWVNTSWLAWSAALRAAGQQEQPRHREPKLMRELVEQLCDCADRTLNGQARELANELREEITEVCRDWTRAALAATPATQRCPICKHVEHKGRCTTRTQLLPKTSNKWKDCDCDVRAAKE